MPRDDGDRPKKSWREIDQSKDRGGSGQREQRGPSSERLQQSNAYRSYKAQLNKIFDGGGLPEAMKAKLAESGVGASAVERKAALKAILETKTQKDTTAALQAFAQAHGGFPDDEEVLAKLVDGGTEDEIREALATLSRLQAESGLKRGASLKIRLKTVQVTQDDPEIRKAAKELLAKL